MKELVIKMGTAEAAVKHLTHVFRMGRPQPQNASQLAELEELERKYRKKLLYQMDTLKKSGRGRVQKLQSTFARTEDNVLFATQSQSSASGAAEADEDDDSVALSQVHDMKLV